MSSSTPNKARQKARRTPRSSDRARRKRARTPGVSGRPRAPHHRMEDRIRDELEEPRPEGTGPEARPRFKDDEDLPPPNRPNKSVEKG